LLRDSASALHETLLRNLVSGEGKSYGRIKAEEPPPNRQPNFSQSFFLQNAWRETETPTLRLSTNNKEADGAGGRSQERVDNAGYREIVAGVIFGKHLTE
jgi:hypothetical protein